MGRNKFKYVFLIISIMILIWFLIYFSYKLFFSKGYILSVNDKNKQEISELLEKEGIEEDKFTKLELKQGFRNGELKVYNYFEIKDTKKVSEGSNVMWYILENGYSTSFKYIFLILGMVILIAINKELINSFNQKESKE